MASPSSLLVHHVAAVLERHRRQNGRAPLGASETERIGARLAALIAARGLPRRLGADEMGRPGEMSDAEVKPLVDYLLEESACASELAAPTRQLVKACFHPEFRTCRDSYREREADGTCRRQQLGKARTRISGSHCVDCPYWTSLTREQHEACLARGWAGDAAEFATSRGVFLPEDFRALRRWLDDEARRLEAPAPSA